MSTCPECGRDARGIGVSGGGVLWFHRRPRRPSDVAFTRRTAGPSVPCEGTGQRPTESGE